MMMDWLLGVCGPHEILISRHWIFVRLGGVLKIMYFKVVYHTLEDLEVGIQHAIITPNELRVFFLESMKSRVNL